MGRLRSALHNASRRREAAASLSEFAALRAAPSDLGSHAAGGIYTLEWPGRGRVAVSSDGVLTAGQIVINGHSIAAGAANAVLRGPWLEEGKTLSLVTDAGLGASTLKVYVIDEWNRPYQVATATVT